MTKLRIHVLFEHGADGQPYGSAQIRLLRPLTYPALHDALEVTSGLAYDGQPVDAVILDRLWQSDISLTLAAQILEAVHRSGARLIYAIDDNFLDLPASVASWFTPQHRHIVEFFLSQADGVIVTTEGLRQRFEPYNHNIVVMPHALDERLLVPRRRTWREIRFGHSRIVIGYMGTFSHDDDLLMILPALHAVKKRYADRIEFQIVGVAERAETHDALHPLDARVIPLRPETVEYTRFMPWFMQLKWDIALAPLSDSPFTRCKSDIKFLDYSALGAAGIYSRVPAYESTVRHRETGWLTENTSEAWRIALETLLTNKELRTTLAQAASHYLYGERTLAKSSPTWPAALSQLLQQAKLS